MKPGDQWFSTQATSFLSRPISILGLATVLFGTPSCSWFGSDSATPSDPVEESTQMEESSAAQTSDSPLRKTNQTENLQDKNQAKLWARIDELEAELSKTRQRMRVLEKGLTLGLIPDELENQANGETSPAKVSSESREGPVIVESERPIPSRDERAAKGGASSVSEPEPNAIPTGFGEEGGEGVLSKEQEAEYQRRLASAQDHFRSARYGRAIVEYSAIGKDFGDRVRGGSHKYWIALSWAHLREFQTARQHFLEFLAEFPTSAWVPRAKFDLARVNHRLGLKEQAVQMLNDVIRDYPNQDAAEMAKSELKAMEKAL